MSVLLNLPNELSYDIMTRWINYDHEYYMTLLLIDAVVKCNSDLRLLLLNHFNFCKSFEKKYFISRIDFNWEEGYSCDVIDDCAVSWFRWNNHLQVEGVHPIARRIIYRRINDKEIPDAIQFINNCLGVKEIQSWSDKILIGLSQHFLAGLTSIEIGNSAPILYHFGFEQIKLHCKQLTKFLVVGYKDVKVDTLLTNIMNSIVINNPSLQSIAIFTNHDIFNILINGNYNNLHRITLHIREMSVSNIFKIINKYPHLTNCTIHCFNFTCSWRLDEIDNDSDTMSEKVEWIFYNLDNILLCDAAEYAGTTTTSIRIISVESLNNFLLTKFKKLHTLDISCSLVDINWMETVHCLPLTLNNLILCRISVSVVIAALNCCRHLTRCKFERAIDDSHNDLTIVTQLRTTLSEYPECLSKFEVSFNIADGYIKYVNGKLTACETMKHYVNTEQCIEDHGYWTETLMRISRCDC